MRIEVTDPVVIVGAGHGGTTLAALLRQGGFTAPIVVVGAEPHLPYHRPPLSKKFSGPEAEQALRPEDFYAANTIDLRRGISVIAIDRSAMRVSLSDGTQLPYRALVLATGSTPRPLPVPGADAPVCSRCGLSTTPVHWERRSAGVGTWPSSAAATSAWRSRRCLGLAASV